MSSLPRTPMRYPLVTRSAPRIGQPPLVAALSRLWLLLVCVALAGYALMGRGFAYIGLPPLFIGELLAVSGVVLLLFVGRWWPILKLPPFTALIVLFAWCGLRTLPYVGQYKIDALRDAIIYAYGVYAFAIAAVLICQPALLRVLVDRYKRFFKVFLIAVPFLWLIFQFFGPLRANILPTWPWASGMPVIWLKAGDLQVHLGAVLAFWASQAGGLTAGWWFAPMFLNAAMLGPVNRGGMLAFLAAICTSLIFKPANRWAWGFIGIGFFGFMVLVVTGVSFTIPGSERPISAAQLVENFLSVGSKSRGNLDELQGTKEWRINFWTAIINDTVYGPYKWTGRGFGVNLVSEYGFNIDEEETVRAPHNGHITMLARAGEPGLAIWILVHVSWVLGMVDGYLRALWQSRRKWAGLFMFLLIYWLLIMINASFDPYIEGPMGGVWLWCVFGVGCAAMWLRPLHPELFDDPIPEPQTVGLDQLV